LTLASKPLEKLTAPRSSPGMIDGSRRAIYTE